MICQPCAWYADQESAGKPTPNITRCSQCLRQIDTYSTSGNLIMVHKVSNPSGAPGRVRCTGSGLPALRFRHPGCTGCDCQHHPVKEK